MKRQKPDWFHFYIGPFGFIAHIDFILPSVKFQIVIKTLIPILLSTYSVYSLIFFPHLLFFCCDEHQNLSKIALKSHKCTLSTPLCRILCIFFEYHAMDVLFGKTFPQLVTLTALTYILNDQIKCWNRFALIAFNKVNGILLLMLMECLSVFVIIINIIHPIPYTDNRKRSLSTQYSVFSSSFVIRNKTYFCYSYV